MDEVAAETNDNCCTGDYADLLEYLIDFFLQPYGFDIVQLDFCSV